MKGDRGIIGVAGFEGLKGLEGDKGTKLDIDIYFWSIPIISLT